MQDRKITDRIRGVLKKPIGKLLGPVELAKRLGEKSSITPKPRFLGNHFDPTHAGRPLIVSVGDITTLELLAKGIIPDVSFFDYICKREAISKEQKERLEGFKAKKMNAENSPGIVSAKLMGMCKLAFSPNQKYPIKVVVGGEEDLAVLCVIIHAPIGSRIIYGQPDRGAVLVMVNARQKRRAREFYDESIPI